MDPLRATGLVFGSAAPTGGWRFMGTCFAFRRPTYLLTAAHCIKSLRRQEIRVIPSRAPMHEPVEVICHKTADIALLKFASPLDIEVFSDAASNLALGEDFIAYGFPEDTLGEDAYMPTARIFRGYFQRFVQYKSFRGYEYFAGELSMPCPGGLSGGPLFRPRAYDVAIGLVTENLQSSTILRAEEELDRQGILVKTKYQEFINYGVALILDRVRDWLDQNAPGSGSA
jgi:hypothetical protein